MIEIMIKMVYVYRKEVKRQLFHLVFGIIIALFVLYGILNRISMGIALVFALILCFVCRKVKIPGIYWFLDKFEREKDLIKNPGKGAFFYLLGSYIAVLLFDKNIAIASIVILALGDSVSHLVGRFGSIPHPFTDKKFLEGLLAGIVVSFIGAVIVLGNGLEAILGSTIAMLVESFDIRIKGYKIDDNLFIPMVAGAVILAVRFFI